MATLYYTRLSAQESAYGTDPASGNQSYRVLKNTHKYKPEFDPVRTVESGVEVQRKEKVGEIASGTVEMNIHLDKKFGRWFAMVMGKETYTTTATTVGQHVFTFLPQITSSIKHPSFTMAKGIGIQERPYTGCFGKKMKIVYKAGKLVEFSVDTVSKKFGADTSLATLSDFSTQAYLSGAHIATQTVGGSNVLFEDFTIEVDGPAVEAVKGGDLGPNSVDSKPASVKFSGTVRFLTETELEAFLAGTNRAIVIKFTHTDTIAGSSPSTPYSIQFDIYRLKFEDGDIELNKQERLMQILSGELEQDGSGNLFAITLQDETASAFVS